MADEETPMAEERDDEDQTIPMKREPKPKTGSAADGCVGGSGGVGGGISSYTAFGNEKIPPSRK